MSKTYNLYCDESCHIENDHKPYMFLASICSSFNQVKKHTEKIKEIKLKHNFFAEIKWSSVSKSKLDFYLELIDYFYATDLSFRTVGIVKDKINYHAFNKSYDEFYYTMYYYLLNNNIHTENSYNVYLDIKDTLSARKVNKLKEILNIKFGVFRNVQNIRSHESLLMQLTDLLMGAISYLHNDREKLNPAKKILIEKIQEQSKDKLQRTNYSSKFNLFFIELR
ncbi:hypothetical protein ABIC45_002728 [Mucilaginibacter rubeus]|uniref:DUF3800 domain-containing protein n=1 Tax=Mucilaginibacter rubeus TaxID=2027860 RepID=UPI0033911790